MSEHPVLTGHTFVYVFCSNYCSHCDFGLCKEVSDENERVVDEDTNLVPFVLFIETSEKKLHHTRH